VGTALLDALIARCKARGATIMSLDVRESNTAALKLYERHGFITVGRRRGYYHHPSEDGLLMRAELPATPFPQPSPKPQ
jgi:ribosomal-protein-alanine N-acetyltransferase